jgi:hypothetical protein
MDRLAAAAASAPDIRLLGDQATRVELAETDPVDVVLGLA